MLAVKIVFSHTTKARKESLRNPSPRRGKAEAKTRVMRATAPGLEDEVDRLRRKEEKAEKVVKAKGRRMAKIVAVPNPEAILLVVTPLPLRVKPIGENLRLERLTDPFAELGLEELARRAENVIIAILECADTGYKDIAKLIRSVSIFIETRHQPQMPMLPHEMESGTFQQMQRRRPRKKSSKLRRPRKGQMQPSP